MKLTIIIIILIAFALGVLFYLKNKKKEKKLADDRKKDRLPNKDKTVYNGIVLSDHRGKFKDPDDGWYKGWVCGKNTAIITAHANISKGKKIHTYDKFGERHERTVMEVHFLGYDTDIVKLDSPWPENVKIWKIGNSTDKLRVMHKDGKWSSRKLQKDDGGYIWVDVSARNVDKSLINGESGLPWINSRNEIVGHTYKYIVERSPSYSFFRYKINKQIK